MRRIFTKKLKEKYILLINYNNLGDIVCDTPSLRNIRKAYPRNKIMMLVRNQSCVEFMKACPYVDVVIEMPHSNDAFKKYKNFANYLIKFRFDFSVQFVRPFNEYYRTYLPYMIGVKTRYGLIQIGYEKVYKKAFNKKVFLDNTTTRTEESLLLVKLANIPVDSEKTECFIDYSKVKKFNFKDYIIIQTCATLNSRMWHKDRFISLIKKISESNPDLTILLTGVKKEEDYIDSIREICNNKKIITLCDINISTLLDLIKNANLLITNDTGPFHFAVAYAVPVIAIFGISPPEYLIKEPSKKCLYFRGSNVCDDMCDLKNENCINIYKCGQDYQHCINNVSVDEVYAAFLQLIKNKELTILLLTFNFF